MGVTGSLRISDPRLNCKKSKEKSGKVANFQTTWDFLARTNLWFLNWNNKLIFHSTCRDLPSVLLVNVSERMQ